MENTLCVGVAPAVQELREFARVEVGAVNRALVVERSASGKAINVARVLRQLGGTPLVLGFAGGGTGQFLRLCLRREGIAQRLTPARRPTRVCITILDRAKGTVTELVEEAQLPTADEWRRFFSAVERASRRARRIVIAGALMPGAEREVYRRLTRLGPPVLVDSQGEPVLRALAGRPFIVKMNVSELERTLGRRYVHPRAVVAGARELLKQGAQHAVVTDGPRGAWLISLDMVWHYRPPRITPVNPIGSGDAMTAGICRALDRGVSLPDAVRCGVACGAANALTRVAGSVRLSDVRRLEQDVCVRSHKHN
mgnify:CR=1 FL=1